MKLGGSNDPEKSLTATLSSWQVKDPLPLHFQDQVWLRIDRAESGIDTGIWAQLIGWLSHSLARPSLAVSYVAILLLAGLIAGYWQAQMEKTRATEALSSRYVQMLDPYQARH